MSQVGDVKVRLILTIYEDDAILDISTSTAKSIIIRKPNGEILTVTATFLTDGSDGKIYYDTVSGDLDQSGMYKIQGSLLINSGIYKSSVKMFRVECNLS